jgi:hypothetical protein
MDEKNLLLAQLRALLDQLAWAESSLATDKIEPSIRQAASVGFAGLFRRRRSELTHLQTSVSKRSTFADSWNQLRKSSASCGELFEECRGFLGGAMLRSPPREKNICDIADALLVGLSRETRSPWPGVTLPAKEHFFTETTGLIGLPFPDYGIWNLPIAVHELGHFIAPRIPEGSIGDEDSVSPQLGFPFQDLLRQNLQDNLIKDEAEQLSGEKVAQKISYLRELFSDLFAVYALGPAYACSCILLRFDPQDDTACEDGDTHPSHGKRVHTILRGLREMSNTTEGDPYEKIINNLKVLWDWNLKRAGHEKCLDEKEIPPSNALFFRFYALLTKFAPTVQYLGWDRAVELSKGLALDRKPEALLKETDAISDVLNAAWLWRLRQTVENSNTVHEVNVESIALCREIIRRAPEVPARR